MARNQHLHPTPTPCMRECEPLARWLAQAYGDHSDPDESLSQAWEAVWHAARTWIPGKGCTFQTWARWHARSRLRTLRQRFARRRDSEFPSDALERHAAPANDVDRQRVAEEFPGMLKAVAELPPRQREAVTLVYLRGMTQGEAAGVMHVSHAAVWDLLRKAMAKLRARAEEAA